MVDLIEKTVDNLPSTPKDSFSLDTQFHRGSRTKVYSLSAVASVEDDTPFQKNHSGLEVKSWRKARPLGVAIQAQLFSQERSFLVTLILSPTGLAFLREY